VWGEHSSVVLICVYRLHRHLLIGQVGLLRHRLLAAVQQQHHREPIAAL
jgi:hypothetical protein